MGFGTSTASAHWPASPSTPEEALAFCEDSMMQLREDNAEQLATREHVWNRVTAMSSVLQEIGTAVDTFSWEGCLMSCGKALSYLETQNRQLQEQLTHAVERMD